MLSQNSKSIRLCEWASISVSGLAAHQRVEINEAVESWRRSAALPDLPLCFSGPDGSILNASHYVGVVEAGGCSIEIYPKLDAALLQNNEPAAWQSLDGVMSNLLWMLEVSGFMDLTEADTASLAESSLTFCDLFAYLMAKNLRAQLERGVVHSYVGESGDLLAVRGQIDLLTQIGKNRDRFDKVSCHWDEFTPDIPLNRIFKCACGFLQPRVRNQAAVRALEDCFVFLEDVGDLQPQDALREVHLLRWNRANDRFHRCFDMAARLLAGAGYHLAHGASDTFVFLLDMNCVFECFAAAAIAARFVSPIETQSMIGHLFAEPQVIRQYPDYMWTDKDHKDRRWIGDAKYKHLAGDRLSSVLFDPEDSSNGTADVSVRADRVLSPQDVRQLTTYAELLRRKEGLPLPPAIAIFYPYVGQLPAKSSKAIAWNGSDFWLVPVRMVRQEHLKDAIPELLVS